MRPRSRVTDRLTSGVATPLFPAVGHSQQPPHPPSPATGGNGLHTLPRVVVNDFYAKTGSSEGAEQMLGQLFLVTVNFCRPPVLFIG
jgi:hypothetical protein